MGIRTLAADSFDAAGELSAYIIELCVVGLVGLPDPPRAEARQAMAEYQHAGIAVKVITCNCQTTATAIGAELGLAGRTVSGAEIDTGRCGRAANADLDRLSRHLGGITPFSRAAWIGCHGPYLCCSAEKPGV